MEKKIPCNCDIKSNSGEDILPAPVRPEEIQKHNEQSYEPLLNRIGSLVSHLK
jgi:hypothetical protein